LDEIEQDIKAFIKLERWRQMRSHFEPPTVARSAALLVMDYQVDTLTRFTTAAQSAEPSPGGASRAQVNDVVCCTA